LKYEWKIASKGAVVKTFTEANPSFTFSKPGIYNATLIVTDPKGEKAEATLELLAGNEPPVLTFDITKGNKTFFFPGQTFNYNVTVSDKEDGSLAKKTISPEAVAVTVDYLKEGFDKVEIAQGHRSADENTSFVKGQQLIEGSDCKACHNVEKKSIGPSYKSVAEKYKDKPEETERLAKKIINGGSGVWGEVAMAAHPTIKIEEAMEMVKYILNIANEKKVETLPSTGSYTTALPEGDMGIGVYILRAAYTDKGSNSIPGITSEKIITLRSSNLVVASADELNGIQVFKLKNPPLEIAIPQKNNAYAAFENIDLTNITEVEFTVNASKERNNAGGKIEIRSGSLTGPKLGETEQIVPLEGTTNNMAPRKVSAKITPVIGVQKVYLVFKNESIKDDQPLFSAVSALFKNEGLKQ